MLVLPHNYQTHGTYVKFLFLKSIGPIFEPCVIPEITSFGLKWICQLLQTESFEEIKVTKTPLISLFSWGQYHAFPNLIWDITLMKPRLPTSIKLRSNYIKPFLHIKRINHTFLGGIVYAGTVVDASIFWKICASLLVIKSELISTQLGNYDANSGLDLQHRRLRQASRPAWLMAVQEVRKKAAGLRPVLCAGYYHLQIDLLCIA